jgi:hypothetical protein
MRPPKYTKAVGQKFYQDGSVRPFPGNTVIAKVLPSLPIYAGLVEAQERFRAADSSGKYVFLPPSSFHMTIIEGLCDQVRTPELWSHKLDLQLPLAEVNQFILECFTRLSRPSSFTMRISQTTIPRWLVIKLEPANSETSQSLQRFREEYSQETGIRFPNHDRYTYHISLAYNLLQLTADEERMIHSVQQEVQSTLAKRYPSIALDEPHLTTFEDMFRFDTVCS